MADVKEKPDIDTVLAAAIAHIAKDSGVLGSPTISALALALHATRAEIAEVRAELAADREAERVFLESIGARVVHGDAPPQRAGHLKHGPGGTGADGPCDPDCAKCAVERIQRLQPLADSPGTCETCGGLAPLACLRCGSCEEAHRRQIEARAAQLKLVDQLRAALREALERWDGWNEQEYAGTKFYDKERARILELWALIDGSPPPTKGP